MGAAAAWTVVMVLWHGASLQLPARPVENPLACYKAAQIEFIEWSREHAGATLLRWGCSREPEMRA